MLARRNLDAEEYRRIMLRGMQSTTPPLDHDDDDDDHDDDDHGDDDDDDDHDYDDHGDDGRHQGGSWARSAATQAATLPATTIAGAVRYPAPPGRRRGGHRSVHSPAAAAGHGHGGQHAG